MSTVLLGLVAVSPASAQLAGNASEDRMVSLRYEVSEGCPDEATFRELVASRLGRDPVQAEARESAEVRVEGTRELVASLRVRDGSQALVGERTLRGARGHCGELVDALAVALGILLEDWPAPPEVVPTPGDAAPVEPTAVPPAPVQAHVEGPPPPAAEETPVSTNETVGPTSAGPPERLELAIALGAQGTAGLLPQVALGGHVEFGLRVGSFVAWLGGEGDFLLAPTSVPPSAGGASGSIDAYYAGGTLALCGVIDPVSLCATGLVGAFDSVVRGVVEPTHRVSLVAAVGARVLVQLDLGGGVSIQPWLSVVGVPLRVALVVDSEVVWEMAPIAGQLGLDLALRFSP